MDRDQFKKHWIRMHAIWANGQLNTNDEMKRAQFVEYYNALNRFTPEVVEEGLNLLAIQINTRMNSLPQLRQIIPVLNNIAHRRRENAPEVDPDYDEELAADNRAIYQLMSNIVMGRVLFEGNQRDIQTKANHAWAEAIAKLFGQLRANWTLEQYLNIWNNVNVDLGSRVKKMLSPPSEEGEDFEF